MNGAIAHNLGRGGAINLKNFGTLKTKQCVRIFKFWQTSDFAIFGHTWRLPHFERQISTTTHQTADSFRWNFLKQNELLKCQLLDSITMTKNYFGVKNEHLDATWRTFLNHLLNLTRWICLWLYEVWIDAWNDFLDASHRSDIFIDCKNTKFIISSTDTPVTTHACTETTSKRRNSTLLPLRQHAKPRVALA